MTETASPPDRAAVRRGPDWFAILAVSALIAGLFPGRVALGAGLLFALAALATGITALRRGAGSWLLFAGVLLLLPIGWYESRPLPEPQDLLPRAAETVQLRWQSTVERLLRSIDAPPPAGSDYGWLDERRRSLGENAGLAVLAPEGVLAWSGWTTPLQMDEREALVPTAEQPARALVLRRGLLLRLLVARRAESQPGLLLAEFPLPAEPDPGFLGEGLPAAIEVRLRWEALGEGIQAELGGEETGGEGSAYWSLVPLMGPGGELLARATISRRAAIDIGRRRQEFRRAGWSLIAALLFVGSAFAGRPAAAGRLFAARLLWVWVPPGGALPAGIAASWQASWTDWAPLAPGGPGYALFGTPFAAACTGLALVGVAALVALPRRRWRARALAVIATAGALAAAGAAAWLTMITGVDLGPLLEPAPMVIARLLLVIGLVAPCWACLHLAGRLLPLAGGGRRWWIASAGVAAGLAGLLHCAALDPAARRIAERRLAPEVLGRAGMWSQALYDTLDLAVPSGGSTVLARERDAVDLWWNSALGRLGLASGVFRYDAEGRIEDRFVSGIPPVDPEPQLAGVPEDPAGPFPQRFLKPSVVEQQFLEGGFRLILAEARRPDGGSWIAAILASPGNIPSRRQGGSLVLGLRPSEASVAERLRRRIEPALAWFDSEGRLRDSDLEAGPPPPLAPPPTPRWRSTRLESGDRARLYEIGDTAGTVSLVVVSPRLLEMAASAVSWIVCLLLLALVCLGLFEFRRAPREALASAATGFRRIGSSFRIQLGVGLLLAGLIPLLALAGAGRTAALTQARQRLTGEGERTAHFARRLVEDYLALGEGEVLDTAEGELVVAWLARTLGEDLFLWEDGRLLAGSRPDLVRAGAWPERLAGETWRALTRGRRPLVVERARVGRGAPGATVVHAPYRGRGGRTGVLTLPLAHAGARFEQSVRGMDRALLVSTALLLALVALGIQPVSRRLVAPLADLEQATGRIAAGRFDAEIPQTGYEETRTLGRALRQMADSLDAQQRVLERRREAIETIIASMPVAVLAVGRGGRVWAANPRAEALLGVEAETQLSLGGGPLDEEVRRVIDARGDLQSTVEAGSGEKAARLRLSAVDLPGRIDDDELRLVVIEDLTDTLRSERLAAWAEMARRIAHEIKNPLTPISLMVDHVRELKQEEDPRWAKALDRCLETIVEQVAVLKQTAREFSDYSRLLRARTEALDLAESLPSWLAPYELAPRAGVRFVIEGGPAPAPLEADPRLLRRAVVNLVENALAAAADGGGQVSVRWELPEDAPRLAIHVIDDGPGIDSEHLPRLFEPDVTTRETGTGLGLPIARQAVEAHGGRIVVDSRPGEGSTFSIELPLGQQED